MIWRHRRGAFDLSRQGLIMGILNVTPDSFSDGGRHFSVEAAVGHGLRLVHEGAGLLDIGGESTRPGAAPVTEEEEMRRIEPVIRALRRQTDIPISIDTRKPAVAEAALCAGADILNDITALADPALGRLAAREQAGVVLMHMQGEPATMQDAPRYADVVAEVLDFLRHRISFALGCGMTAEQIAIDPGIGFGKRWEHNLALLREVGQFAALGRPVLIGVSRKSFLKNFAASDRMDARLAPALAITSQARRAGAAIFRVHEPQPHGQVLRMTEALLADV